MTDKPDNQESPSDETKNTEHMIPKSRFDTVNNQLKEVKAQLQQLTDAKAQTDEATRKQRETELAEQNRYKELYEQQSAELATLRSLQGEVKRYRDSFESTLNARLAGIPEDKKHLVPEFDDPIKLSAWLDKAMPDLVTPPKPNAPRLDGGSGSADGRNVNLSAGQQSLADIARQMGYPVKDENVAQYAKRPVKPSDKSGDT